MKKQLTAATVCFVSLSSTVVCAKEMYQKVMLLGLHGSHMTHVVVKE
jgi:hypothetical protein